MKLFEKMAFIKQAAVPRKTKSSYLQSLQTEAITKTNPYQEKSFSVSRDQNTPKVVEREPVFAPLKIRITEMIA